MGDAASPDTPRRNVHPMVGFLVMMVVTGILAVIAWLLVRQMS